MKKRLLIGLLVTLALATLAACKSKKTYNFSPVTIPYSSSIKLLSNRTLCSGATSDVGAETAYWAPSLRSFTDEAKRRGLTLKECAQLAGKKFRVPYETALKERERKQEAANRSRRLEIEAERQAENRRIRLAQQERNRKLEVDRQRKAEAKRIRVAKLEQAKKQKTEERRQRELVRKRKLADAHEREMLPIRKRNKSSLAVIIGNRNYNGRTPTVDFAHNDADAMKHFIINKLGYRSGNVFDLRDAGVNAISAVLGNEKSHEGDLFNAIRKGKSDVIVYYSGHGVPGLKDERPYLLPVDGDPNSAEITGFSVDTMYANLAKLPARSVTVFLDACFSGESEKGMLVSSASGISVTAKLPSSKGQMTVITAAQGNQLASWDPKARHGLFTKHLLDALNGEADSKEYGNYDGKVSLSEIQNYLDEEMTYQARATWKRRQNAYVRGSGDTILSTVFRVP
jgi:hypothetical protein